MSNLKHGLNKGKVQLNITSDELKVLLCAIRYYNKLIAQMEMYSFNEPDLMQSDVDNLIKYLKDKVSKDLKKQDKLRAKEGEKNEC